MMHRFQCLGFLAHRKRIRSVVSDPPDAGRWRWRNRAAVAVCLFASVAMIGDVLGLKVLKGLGAVSAVAPFPKVFCSLDGMEGFACEFTILYEQDGQSHRLPITPELYARLGGPYNRRNVYGAALAGGPKLPRPLWEAVFRHGFASGGPLQREFGIPPDATNVRVFIRSRTRGCNETWLLQPGDSRSARLFNVEP